MIQDLLFTGIAVIDDAIYMNIIDFLEDMRNEYEEDKNE